MYLVDTNVLSAGAPTKAVATPDLIAWMDRNSAGLFLSVITIAEIDPPPPKWSALKYGFEPTRGRIDAEEDPRA